MVIFLTKGQNVEKAIETARDREKVEETMTEKNWHIVPKPHHLRCK